MFARPALAPRSRGFVITSLLFTALAAVAAVGFLLLLVAAWWYQQLPSLDKVVNYKPQAALQVFTSDGVEIGQFGSERRTFLRHPEFPKLLRDAVLAVEDVRFYDHHGIDARGVARALVSNMLRGKREGASTITQQVARNILLSHERTMERKVKEAMLAIKIENALSKDQILELYLNQIFLGQRSYGFAAAAQTYFGKKVGELNLAEIAMLAGLPKNPGYANPISSLERATARQQVVLMRMQDVGVITAEQRSQASQQKLVLRRQQDLPLHAEYVAEIARQAVFERFGEAAYSNGYQVHTTLIAAEQEAAQAAVRRGVLNYERRRPYEGPEDFEELNADESDASAVEVLKDFIDDEDLRAAIVLTASPKQVTALLATGERITLQGEGLRWAQPALSPKADEDLAIKRGSIIRVMKTEKPTAPKVKDTKDAKNGKDAAHPTASTHWTISQWPEVESALVSLTPQTGRVRALVGGFDFGANQFNRVTQGWRQPGSSFKPFLYSAALEQGITPTTVVNDAPFVQEGTDWNPKNSDGSFEGPMTVRRALTKSKNLVSIRLLKQIGIGTAKSWATRFGFDPAKQPDNLTMALGTGSVTPMQMASAYGTFANGGYLLPPVVIERISDTQGNVLYQAPPPPHLDTLPRAIPEGNAFITNTLLQDVTRYGTAARAQSTLQRSDLFGKTGTTNDSVDAWFAGFQPSVVAVVWMGYDQPQSLGSNETGGGLALPIWLDYMARVLKGLPQAKLTPPEGVEQVAGDWRYTQEPFNGWVRSIDLPARAPDDEAAAEGDGASPSDTHAADPPGSGPNSPPSSPAPTPAPGHAPGLAPMPGQRPMPPLQAPLSPDSRTP